MDLETVTMCQVTQSEKTKYDLVSMWNLKEGYKWTYLLYKMETELHMWNTDLWLPGVKMGENKLEDWD